MGVSHELAAGPVTVERLSHSVDPGLAFEAFHPLPYPFFLDSGLPGPRLGRWSLLGAAPRVVLSCKGRRQRWLEDGVERPRRGNPFAALRKLLRRWRVPRGDYPVPLVSGLVGYLGYDLCHFVERLPRTAADDVDLPDLHFGLYDAVAVRGKCGPFACNNSSSTEIQALVLREQIHRDELEARRLLAPAAPGATGASGPADERARRAEP